MTHTLTIEIPDEFAVTIGGETVTFKAEDVHADAHRCAYWSGWSRLNNLFAAKKSAVLKPEGAIWLTKDDRSTRDEIVMSVYDGTIMNTMRGAGQPGLSDLQRKVAVLAEPMWRKSMTDSEFSQAWKGKAQAERYAAILLWLSSSNQSRLLAKAIEIAERQIGDLASLEGLSD